MQMPVLKNSRHERFVQLLPEGKTAVDAHEKAGYKRNDGNASTLARHPEVQARLKEITSARARQGHS
jgi:phage terminase small subunit